jgi:hypothetical protein
LNGILDDKSRNRDLKITRTIRRAPNGAREDVPVERVGSEVVLNEIRCQDPDRSKHCHSSRHSPERIARNEHVDLNGFCVGVERVDPCGLSRTSDSFGRARRELR